MLFVCTGNLCRSPMAERLMLARLRVGADVRVHSAGTRAAVGRGMDQPSAQVLRELGGDPEGHVAVQLQPGDVERAGLILTATSEHRSRVVQETPRAMRRAFTVREFARLGARVEPPESLVAQVAAVAAQRGYVDPPEAGADEILDPIGQSAAFVQEVGRQLDDSVAEVVRILGLDR